MTANLATSQLHSKIELLHNETDKTSRLEISKGSFKQLDKSQFQQRIIYVKRFLKTIVQIARHFQKHVKRSNCLN